MEEELQQSVMLAENAEWDPSDGNDVPMSDAAHTTSNPNSTANTKWSNDNSADDGSDQLSDRDASGEEDHDIPQAAIERDSEEDGEDEDEGDQDDEDMAEEGTHGMRHSDDEMIDEESEVSDLQSAADESDEEAPWEDARDTAEDDEESDAVPPNNCMFCKQDEENDPSEEYEAYLSCAGCGVGGMCLSSYWCSRELTATCSSSAVRSRGCGNDGD
jgi:histone acetyltransferase SAS3